MAKNVRSGVGAETRSFCASHHQLSKSASLTHRTAYIQPLIKPMQIASLKPFPPYQFPGVQGLEVVLHHPLGAVLEAQQHAAGVPLLQVVENAGDDVVPAGGLPARQHHPDAQGLPGAALAILPRDQAQQAKIAGAKVWEEARDGVVIGTGLPELVLLDPVRAWRAFAASKRRNERAGGKIRACRRVPPLNGHPLRNPIRTTPPAAPVRMSGMSGLYSRRSLCSRLRCSPTSLSD